VRAWRAGTPLRVACSLRGDTAPFPRHVRQGHLVLDCGAITWFPFWSVARAGVRIPVPAAITGVREPGRAEWNVKRPGRAFGIIPIPDSRTIFIEANGATLELTVTAIDEPLVEAALVLTKPDR
jgi:hypothetical protein